MSLEDAQTLQRERERSRHVRLVEQLREVVGPGIAALRLDIYGGVPLTDDQVRERTNAIVAVLLGNFSIVPLD